MLAATRRTVKFLLIAAITVAFAAFAIDNREFVTLDLSPLPQIAMPKFLAATLCFILGALAGGMTVWLKADKSKRLLKAEHKRVMALQNEIQTMNAERSGLPAVAPKS